MLELDAFGGDDIVEKTEGDDKVDDIGEQVGLVLLVSLFL